MSAHVLFDLDGTIVDSAPGIQRCLVEAVRAVGGTPPPVDSLTRWIGSPIHEVFGALLPGAGPSTIERSIVAYRDVFERIGIQDGRPYAGIADALRALRDDGWTLYVATVKRQDVAEQVLEHVGLAPLFRSVHGTSAEHGRATKTEVLAHALATDAIPPASATMVGDRHHDVEAALALGARPVGVSWGYGSLDELRDAAVVLDAPMDLVGFLTRAPHVRPPG